MRHASFALGALALSTHQAVEAGVTGRTCIACHETFAPEQPKDDKDDKDDKDPNQ
jgi:cytochrome c5